LLQEIIMNTLTSTRIILIYTTTFLLLLFMFVNDSSNSFLLARPQQRVDPLKAPGDYRYIEYYYSPLTYENFSAIHNNNDEFKAFVISYMSKSNFDLNGVAKDRDSLLIQYIKTKNPDHLNGEVTYKGDLETINESMNTMNELFLKREFTPQEVEAIYKYIMDEDNRDFFFDGSEYKGQDPYISPLAFICDGNYRFSLSIQNPNDRQSSWAIHKCVDEYPAPDHPLYGLFQILENDFISKF
jgi:hypothetical protein